MIGSTLPKYNLKLPIWQLNEFKKNWLKYGMILSWNLNKEFVDKIIKVKEKGRKLKSQYMTNIILVKKETTYHFNAH